MPYSIFKNENIAAGIPPNGNVQAGVSNLDSSGFTAEQNLTAPIAADPGASWVYYDCQIEYFLDSGIVVHRRLPQSAPSFPDTLASVGLGQNDADQATALGVNLQSGDSFQDVVQQMGHSVYRIRLYGQALRAGYQIPIPSLVSIGDLVPTPDDEIPQQAFNKIIGNYSGVSLWQARWSLWYTLVVPPSVPVAPTAPNLATRIDDSVPVPTNGIQLPWSQPDDNAQTSLPTGANLNLQNPYLPPPAALPNP